jgi:type IV secretory pathway VirB9-like protein
MPDGIELALEPNAHPAAQAFQKALFADGIPLASFAVENIQKEYERMTNLGVTFRVKPTKTGPVTSLYLTTRAGTSYRSLRNKIALGFRRTFSME